MHVLETAVVTWTRQIKNVLKQDPEQVLKSGSHPGPLEELAFWHGGSQTTLLLDLAVRPPGCSSLRARHESQGRGAQATCGRRLSLQALQGE